MSHLVFVAVLCFLGAAAASDVVLPCDSGLQPDATVFVDDVECTESPCLFPQGSVVRAVIKFTSPGIVEQITKKVNATIQGTSITTPFPMPNADEGCSDLVDGSSCPLFADEIATISVLMDVKKEYPKIGLIIVMFLTSEVDGVETQLACIKVPAKVTGANNKFN